MSRRRLRAFPRRLAFAYLSRGGGGVGRIFLQSPFLRLSLPQIPYGGRAAAVSHRERRDSVIGSVRRVLANDRHSPAATGALFYGELLFIAADINTVNCSNCPNNFLALPVNDTCLEDIQ